MPQNGAESPLRAAPENDYLYREIVETAQEGIWVVNSTGVTTFANQRLASMLGFMVEEMVGQPVGRFFAGAVIESGQRGERLLQRKDGSSFWAVIDTRRIMSREGEYRGMRASVVDITSRRTVEEQLQFRESQLQNAQEEVSSLGRLAAAVAHEFNILLIAVQPYVDVITRGVDDPKLRAAAAHITDGIARGRRITHDVLKFSRIAEPVARPANVASWLRTIELELAHVAGPRVIIHTDAPTELRMLADPPQLAEAFWNIAANARDAMPNGGALTIAAWRETQPRPDAAPADFVHFTLRDTGTGIASDVLPHIFEPLFTTKKGTSTGLGLAAAQQIVQRQRGDIYAESVAGNGTTIHVIVPAV